MVYPGGIYFSKNHTFTVRNYLTEALLYYIHLAQHAWYNDGIDKELYQGTAKAAEGIATSKAFSLAKEDSCEQVQSPDFRDSGIYRKTYSHLTLYISCSACVIDHALIDFCAPKINIITLYTCSGTYTEKLHM